MTNGLDRAASRGRGPSRRQLLTAAGAGGLALSLGARGGYAAGAENVLRIGFISPRTGALAGFGETDGYVLELARKAFGKGLAIGGKTYQVEILDRDTQSDPSRASQLAKTLINSDGVDLMLPVSTPETINPVADACEAAGVPCLSTVMPWEAWYFGRGGKPGAPSPFKWSYHFGFGGGEFFKAYTSLWNSLETNKKVGVLYPNDADGNAIRENLAPGLAKAGFTIIDPGPYEDGTTDYSAQIAKFKSEKCEIFNTFPIPPDFAAFWRQAAQQGYTKMVKIAQIAKTGLFPSQVDALGNLGYNLTSACYWHKVFPYKSALTGVSGTELADGYEKASGKQWTQQLGASMALIDAGVAALAGSADPKNKAAVAKALGSLNTVTMAGKVDFTSGPFPNISPGPIIGAQWVKAKAGSKFKLDYVVTEHATDPNVPIEAKLVPYN
ncbi:MAG: ABC transporter substrate-binding protein [Roseiarcus sp.]